MGISEDLPILENRLQTLITSYEQYFIGLEKREPLKLLAEVEQLVKRYANSPINNTMYKFRYNNLVARFTSYRQQWNRIVREIEEGRYRRDRYRAELHQKSSPATTDRQYEKPAATEREQQQLDQLYAELLEARRACMLPVEGMSRQQLADRLAKQRPQLQQQLGTEKIRFRVVVENGRPRIRAGLESAEGAE